MSRFTNLTLLGATLALAGCADPLAPGPLRSPVAVLDVVALDDARFARQGPTATPLETLTASIWVVRGRRQTLEIEYTDPDGLAAVDPTVVLQYLKLDFQDRTLLQRPDGTPVATGDSVLVTVTVDPVKLEIGLAPSGLIFDPADPMKLRIRYHRADPDFDGNGTVDANDEVIRTTWLGMWVREDATGLWSRIPAKHSLDSQKFDAELEHFSNYAVAW